MAFAVAIDAGPDGRFVTGDRQIRTGTISLGTYATNGVAVTKANFDLPVVLNHLEVDPSAGYLFEFDKTNSKVKAFRQKDPAAAGGADIALPEVANAVDLSAVLSRFRASGK